MAVRLSHGFEIHFAEGMALTKKERGNEDDAQSSSKGIKWVVTGLSKARQKGEESSLQMLSRRCLGSR